ncbi:unnamed protein product [Amaranthus hypochondriacus]
MAKSFSKILAFSAVLNLLFISLVSACGGCGGSTPYTKPKPRPKPTPTPGTGTSGGVGIPIIGGVTPIIGGVTPIVGGAVPVIGGAVPAVGGGIPVVGGGIPVVGGGSPSKGGSSGHCPIDTLKLGVCANVLNGLVHATIGKPPVTPCCPLIQGLIDAEAAVCLCTAIKANILGINLNIPVSLSLLVNYCGCELPRGFQCP